MQERFVGTIVVVVLGIVLIPLWLDGPEVPAASSRAVDLPGAARSQTIRLDAEERRPVTAPAPAVPSPTVLPVEEHPPVAAPAPAAPNPAVLPAGEPRPAEPTAAPTPRRAAVADPPAEEPALKPAHAAPDAAGWAVQVGSFTRGENAERLATSLEAGGFAAFVSHHAQGGRTLSRVRVGPEPDRAQAEALATRLEQAGHKTQIVREP